MRRQLLFASAVALLVLGVVEGLAFAASLQLDELFDEREKILARLDADSLREFARRRGDPVLGWTRHGPDVAYTFDASGGRSYPGYDAAHARVIAVGDSYTAGAETEDATTWPARLAARLGVAVANHGVGGYDPTQSLLRLEQTVALYPEAEVAVLAIMVENVHRLVNSYRPVLYDDARLYLLKPYFSGGALVPHPGRSALDDVAVFRRIARATFDDDFWARPQRRFPYTLAVLRGLTTNAFLFRELPQDLRSFGISEYDWTFRAERFRRELIAVFERFRALAESHGVRAVVVFFPRSRFDTRSASRFLADQQQRFPAGLVVADAGAAAIDWSRYNVEVQEGDVLDICHPSAYGYDALAGFVAETLYANELAPR